MISHIKSAVYYKKFGFIDLKRAASFWGSIFSIFSTISNNSYM